MIELAGGLLGHFECFESGTVYKLKTRVNWFELWVSLEGDVFEARQIYLKRI